MNPKLKKKKKRQSKKSLIKISTSIPPIVLGMHPYDEPKTGTTESILADNAPQNVAVPTLSENPPIVKSEEQVAPVSQLMKTFSFSAPPQLVADVLARAPEKNLSRLIRSMFTQYLK